MKPRQVLANIEMLILTQPLEIYFITPAGQDSLKFSPETARLIISTWEEITNVKAPELQMP